jgi:DoxX-like family
MATVLTRRNASVFTAQSTSTVRPRRKLSVTLWTLQGILAVLFAMTGSMKLLTPADILAAQTPLPIELVRFIGLCEAAGALGLILPGLLRIRPALTPLAAACLTVLMVCATILTPILMGTDPIFMTLMPFIVGVLTAFVAHGRTRLAPHRSRA